MGWVGVELNICRSTVMNFWAHLHYTERERDMEDICDQM